jgi:myo-inositol-1(or 4)-monophosphatase
MTKRKKTATPSSSRTSNAAKGPASRLKSVSKNKEWQKELKAAFKAADGAKRILNKYFGSLSQVSEKFQAGLVTEADRDSEKYIIQTLHSKFPDHQFLGEESGLSHVKKAPLASQTKVLKGQKVFRWIIDPLDGTTNYVHQFPFFCISIALEVNGEMVVGVVDAPQLKMRFHAVRGQGAFLNNKKIHVSERESLHDGLFATGFSDLDPLVEKQLELCAKIVKEARGLRRAGAAALDLCFVASGSFDVFWEKNLKPWDTAAGSLIAAEAGAVISNLKGEKFKVEMPHIVAGTPKMHAELLKLYREINS